MSYKKDLEEWFKPKRMPHPKLSCGCYLLYDNDIVVYAGQSVNCIERVPMHKDKSYTHWMYYDCNEEDISTLEASLILEYLPKYNKILPLLSGYSPESTILFKARLKKIDVIDIGLIFQNAEFVMFNEKKYYKRSSLDWKLIGKQDPMEL